MSYLTIILLSALLAILPINLAQDPMPTPAPTPEISPCQQDIRIDPLPKEDDTSIVGWTNNWGYFGQPMYALECLAQDSKCRADRILGYAPVYRCSVDGWGCAHMSLTLPLQHDEYIALYIASWYYDPTACAWSVYRVSGAFLPRLYLPILLR